jgi:hypothetical protein
VVSFAEKSERGPVGTGRWLDHVRRETFTGNIVTVREVAAAAPVLGLSLGVFLYLQASLGVFDELAFHVAAQIEIAAMGDAFQFAEFAGRQERKRILNIGRAHGVVA